MKTSHELKSQRSKVRDAVKVFLLVVFFGTLGMILVSAAYYFFDHYTGFGLVILGVFIIASFLMLIGWIVASIGAGESEKKFSEYDD